MIDNPHKFKTYIRRGLVGLLFGIIVIYTAHRTSFLAQGATLAVYNLSDGQIVQESELVIEGRALRATTLILNGREIVINQEGFFSELVLLSPGINTISFRAEDRFEKYEEQTYTVVFEEPQDTTLDTLLQELHTTIQTQTTEILETVDITNPDETILEDTPETPPEDTQTRDTEGTILIESSLEEEVTNN